MGKQRYPAIIGTVQLKKVAQSLIKSPILISKASPSFIISLIINFILIVLKFMLCQIPGLLHASLIKHLYTTIN